LGFALSWSVPHSRNVFHAVRHFLHQNRANKKPSEQKLAPPVRQRFIGLARMLLFNVGAYNFKRGANEAKIL
jgi:hypothetical protein